EWRFASRRRKCKVELGERIRVEDEIERRANVAHVLELRGFGDRADTLCANRPRERHARRRGAETPRDFRERGVAREAAFVERRIRPHRDAALRAPGKPVEPDAAAS